MKDSFKPLSPFIRRAAHRPASPPASHYIVCHLPPRPGSPVPFHSFEFPDVRKGGGGLSRLGPRVRARPSICVIPWITGTAVLGLGEQELAVGTGGGGDSVGMPRVHDSGVPLHVTATLDETRLRKRSALVFWGCRNCGPHRLAYHLTVLQARSPRHRCGQGWLPRP